MSSNIKENQISNEEMIKYLDDVCQIEQAIYVIDQSLENTVNSWSLMADRADKNIIDLMQERVRRLKKWDDEEYMLGEYDKKAKIKPFNMDEPSRIDFTVEKPNVSDRPRNVKGKVLGLIFGILIFLLLVATSSGDGFIEGIIGAVIGIIIIIIGFARDKRMNTKERGIIEEYRRCCEIAEENYVMAKNKYDKELDEYQDQILQDIMDDMVKDIDSTIEKAEDLLDSLNPKIEAYNKTIKPDLDIKREKLSMQRDQLYKYNIIPPDYRTLDCVLMLSHIYRNGLAENMRDAINLYETRVFRGEMVRGINNIFERLGEIAGKLGQVGITLNRIKADINIMSEDLFKLVENSEESMRQQDVMISNQNEIIEQSKLNRMATEAIARSTESLQYYAAAWNAERVIEKL